MFIQQLLNGLANGFVYALLALGFATVYRSMRLINFAQGNFFMAGAFVGLYLENRWHLSFAYVLLLTSVICMVVGMCIERCTLAPLGSDAPEMNAMISTIGLAVVLQGGALIFRGTDEYRFPQLLPTGSTTWCHISIPLHLVSIGSAAIILMVVLATFLRFTKLGLSMRAASQDSIGAEIMGIDVQRTRMIAFGISASIGGAAGVLIAPFWYVFYDMGSSMGLKGFTAAVLGSLGSLPGAILGGLFLGVIENLTAGYISSVWKDAVVFGILLSVLTFRPQGLLGSNAKTRV